MDPLVARHVLGLRTDRPSADELRRAWRAFARENHPDRRPDDPTAARRFAAGRDAYETLLRWDRPARPAPAAAPGPPPATGRPERVHPHGTVLRGERAGRAQGYDFPHVAGREWRA